MSGSTIPGTGNALADARQTPMTTHSTLLRIICSSLSVRPWCQSDRQHGHVLESVTVSLRTTGTSAQTFRLECHEGPCLRESQLIAAEGCCSMVCKFHSAKMRILRIVHVHVLWLVFTHVLKRKERDNSTTSHHHYTHIVSVSVSVSVFFL